ncbi:hypothetical protein FDP41_004692 [Naegleria fowleri]|uniref:RIIa domain-containing protein n=1 Tax=Naegleria fowleri TaxID=5763 RepID=A0A6A5BM82_NAEFO|nr:uncharacterized protein FDP41_004692 [Naegleria fowleri]KAF0976016.1 hypothetical protein FDP41_004692 [Naegleria fowleri]
MSNLFRKDLNFPPQLEETVRDFTREVLLNQPSNISQFGYEYFMKVAQKEDEEKMNQQPQSDDDGKEQFLNKIFSDNNDDDEVQHTVNIDDRCYSNNKEIPTQDENEEEEDAENEEEDYVDPFDPDHFYHNYFINYNMRHSIYWWISKPIAIIYQRNTGEYFCACGIGDCHGFEVPYYQRNARPAYLLVFLEGANVFLRGSFCLIKLGKLGMVLDEKRIVPLKIKRQRTADEEEEYEEANEEEEEETEEESVGEREKSNETSSSLQSKMSSFDIIDYNSYVIMIDRTDDQLRFIMLYGNAESYYLLFALNKDDVEKSVVLQLHVQYDKYVEWNSGSFGNFLIHSPTRNQKIQLLTYNLTYVTVSINDYDEIEVEKEAPLVMDSKYSYTHDILEMRTESHNETYLVHFGGGIKDISRITVQDGDTINIEQVDFTNFDQYFHSFDWSCPCQLTTTKYLILAYAKTDINPSKTKCLQELLKDNHTAWFVFDTTCKKSRKSVSFRLPEKI